MTCLRLHSKEVAEAGLNSGSTRPQFRELSSSGHCGQAQLQEPSLALVSVLTRGPQAFEFDTPVPHRGLSPQSFGCLEEEGAPWEASGGLRSAFPHSRLAVDGGLCCQWCRSTAVTAWSCLGGGETPFILWDTRSMLTVLN